MQGAEFFVRPFINGPRCRVERDMIGSAQVPEHVVVSRIPMSFEIPMIAAQLVATAGGDSDQRSWRLSGTLGNSFQQPAKCVRIERRAAASFERPYNLVAFDAQDRGIFFDLPAFDEIRDLVCFHDLNV